MTFGNNAIITTLVGAIFTLSAGSALAAPAHATGNVNVRTGPGTSYHRVDTLHRGEQVNVSQCNGGWCYVTHSGPDGWVSARYLGQGGYPGPQPNSGANPGVGFSFEFGSGGSSFGFSFGNTPNRPPAPPQPKACFYSGANYSGRSICVAAGRSINYVGDSWNDKVSSVRVYGDASVVMCKHVNFGGFCRTTSRNESALGVWLNNEISSVKVY